MLNNLKIISYYPALWCLNLKITVVSETCGQTNRPPSPTSECCGLDLADDNRKTSKFTDTRRHGTARVPFASLTLINNCTDAVISNDILL